MNNLLESCRTMFIEYGRLPARVNHCVSKIQEEETKFNKELQNFSFDEMYDLFYRIRASRSRDNKIYVRLLYDIIEAYLKQCEALKFPTLAFDALYQIERSTGLKKALNLISDEQFHEAMSNIDEPRSAFVILAMYDGLENSNRPARATNLKIQNLHDGKFDLETKGKILEYIPSSELYSAAIRAYKQKTTAPMAKKGYKQRYNLHDDSYIYHARETKRVLTSETIDDTAKARRSLETSRKLMVIQQLEKFIKDNFPNQDITPKDLIYSGLFNTIKKDLSRLHVSLDDYVDMEQFDALKNRFTCLNPDYSNRRGINCDVDCLLIDYADYFKLD